MQRRPVYAVLAAATELSGRTSGVESERRARDERERRDGICRHDREVGNEPQKACCALIPGRQDRRLLDWAKRAMTRSSDAAMFAGPKGNQPLLATQRFLFLPPSLQWSYPITSTLSSPADACPEHYLDPRTCVSFRHLTRDEHREEHSGQGLRRPGCDAPAQLVVVGRDTCSLDPDS